MVKTRRKSKAAAAAAAAAAEQDQETASTQGTEDISMSAPASSASFHVPIPTDLDIDALSNILPEVSFSKPDPETILGIYRILLAQVAENDAMQRDLEEARAEVDRKEIELDQAIQDGETKTKDLENSLEAVQKELNTIKVERDQLAVSNKDLEALLSSLSTTQSSSSSELDQFKHRIEEAEREKRDLIGVVSRLKEDASQRDEEVQNLRTNLRQARQDHQALETQVRELRSVETSTKFKVDTLSQKLTLAQSETERTNAELTAKSEEYTRFRRSKHAEFIQLQAAHDALTQKHASIENSLRAMQSAHTSQTHQLTQSLVKVQDLQGQLAEQESAFSTEVSGLKRLVTIMEERENQAKEMVDGIEREWASVGDRAEKREAALRAETEKERRAREEVEKKLEQLETVIEKMNRGELPVAGRGATLPGTPGRASAHTADAMMGLSPTVAMATKVQKGGKTFTEVYTDYVRLEEDYANKCAEYDHMDRTLSDVLAQIEERAPILAQQREEYERLQVEATQLANQLSTTLSERDANAASLQEISHKLKKSHQETDLLQQQLTDLARQVQALLKELGRRADPSIPSDEELDQMPADNIDAVITNNLVVFRSIPELQEQNEKLLKIVRELGAKMEAEEREYREALEQEQSEAVREAHEAIQELAAQLDRQKKSSEITIQAYMKERDTFKTMLARADRSVPRSGVNGDVNGVLPAASSDLVAELEEVQAQFESYKTEMGMDAVTLREDLTQAQRELGQANAALAKADAKIEYLNERQRMTQEQLSLQSRDLDNLAMRNQQLYDQQTRLDIDRERVMDELATTKNDLEQLRNESANLRAEKRIWESVQSRLIEENKNLAVERSQLSDLMANVQRMHNDLERSGENDRRRLETQMQMMESQTQDLKVQLSQERDTLRHITLQRDIDNKDFQARLDRTTEQLSQARESLVGAETTKTHLQERVQELTRLSQGNEEKLAVYERRTSGTSTAVPASGLDMPREQQLQQEVAELRSALKVAQVDLAAARSHMQQFQEISQANEAALFALNTTHDQYKADAEAQLARHELEYKSLEEKLHSVEQDLQQSTVKFNELQKILETERAAWANDKKTLEDTIVDMSTSEKHSESDRTAHQREVHALEERAVAAEERYSREVVTHAESFKTIENLKQQLSSAQNASRQNLAEAANAQAKLEASEGSWKQQKEALDKEVADLNARCKDLAAQNALLYQHLESVSSQAARIRQVADSSAESMPGDVDTSSDTDKKLSELRSVVAYLRKEKEIVDLQLELSKQENVRLKSQIDHLTQNLQEARTTLSEERERAIQAATSDAQHAEIAMLLYVPTAKPIPNAHANWTSSSKSFLVELEPAQEQVRVARAELQARDAQITLLESESRRWQERNTQLLSKYDRIDPSDVQTLKDEIESLKTQKADLEKRLADHDTKDADTATRLSTYEDNLRKYKDLTANLRGRLGAVNNEKSSLNKTVSDLQTPGVGTSDATKAQLEVEKAELNKARDEALERMKTAEERANKATDDARSLKLSNDKFQARVSEMQKSRLTAIAEAVEKAKSEFATNSNTEELAKQHAQELEALRAQLLSQHEANLKAAVEAATAAAKPEVAAVSTDDSTKAAIAAAIAVHDQDMQAKHADEISSAVERGRMEQAAKGKLKDAQLVRSQSKVKELEAWVEEWRKAGLIPEAVAATVGPAASAAGVTPPLATQVASTSKAPAAAPTAASPVATSSTSAASAAATAAPANTATPASTGPPRKALGGAVPLGTTDGAGRGRGVARGVLRGRGGLSIRGAAPSRGGAPSPATATPPVGINIMGIAANKRGREDDPQLGDSLAKRIKPADESTPAGATPAAGGSKPPVVIKRPPPP
ncbi:hypothetical protein BU15DRAFT_72775 [Melanogaster broomeanus]|nr:hypothetical protein BU15DRAFT_72775 [Melanogaster broomeanus]